MGRIDQTLGMPEDGTLDISQHKIEIVLSDSEIAELGADDPATYGLAATVNPLELDSPIAKTVVQAAGILCVEVSAASSPSLVRIAELRSQYPNLPIVALVRDPDVAMVRALLRQGVSDVLELPLSIPKLTESVKEIIASLATRPVSTAPRKTGKLVAIVKSTGGVGATNVAVHLAMAVAADHGRDSTCLFDLDVQFGDAATYLGAPATPSLSELLEGGARVDGDFLKTVASTASGGVRLVPAPAEILPIEAVDTDQMQRIIGTARQEFDYVVADLPANWTNWTLGVVAQADMVILVVTLSIASLRQARRQLELLHEQGVDPAKIQVLVNRLERRLFKTIGLEDASKTLGHPVTLSIHNDYPLVNTANNQGVAIMELNKRSKIAKDFAQLAETVSELTLAKVQS